MICGSRQRDTTSSGWKVIWFNLGIEQGKVNGVIVIWGLHSNWNVTMVTAVSQQNNIVLSEKKSLITLIGVFARSRTAQVFKGFSWYLKGGLESEMM